MSLRHGRELLAIPGPSVMPDRVLAAMHRPAPNIYEGEIVGLTETVHRDLRTVAGTEGNSVIYVANGHGAWEAALTNTLSEGDTVLVLASGIFAAGWGRMAAQLGVHVETVDAGPRSAVDPAAVERHLHDDATHRIAAVLVVQVDTASSVVNDIAAVAEAVRSAGHPALVMVDCIASFGCMPVEMDALGLDVVVAASQKGLMVPPGVSFNFVGPRAWEAHRRADLVTNHWSWTQRCRSESFYFQFGGTPPTHHLFGLREALDMLVVEEGLDAAYRRHRVLADAVRACVERWAAGGVLAFNVIEAGSRSDAVTTVLTGDADASAIRSHCLERHGVVLGLGIIDRTAEFRIGHMGHLNTPMVLGALGAVEATLVALGVDHESGLADAAAVLAG